MDLAIEIEVGRGVAVGVDRDIAQDNLCGFLFFLH